MSTYAAPRVGQRKKPYQPPKLTVFGSLSKLTQNGTQGVKENNGKGLCGPLFTQSGSKSC